MNVELVLLGQTVVLVTLSLLLVYPVYAHAQNVMHTWGIVLLAATMLVFTTSSLVGQFTPYVALAEAIHAVSDLTLFAALYLFAREFIRPAGTEEFETPPAAREGGGFEDAAER